MLDLGNSCQIQQSALSGAPLPVSRPCPPALAALLLLGAAPAAASAPPADAPVAAPAPFQPRVSDPMLAPMPPATRAVARWDEALRLLRERSTDERSAQAGVERAQGRWRQALAPLLPNARVSAGVASDLLNPDVPAVPGGGAQGEDGRSPTTPVGTATVSLSQAVLDVGAWRGVDAASAARRSASASLQDVRRRLTQGLARSLVAVVAAERVAELNRLGLRLALERAALTERTQQLGAATQLDVVRVQQDVAVARGTLVAGDEQLRRTREALGFALGFDHDVGVQPAFALQGLVAEAGAQCPALQGPSERPDLVAAREQVSSARASRSQARAGYLPTLGLTSSLFGYTTDPGLGRCSTWNIAAVLSVPLWEGGLREGLVRERAGLETQAVESLESTRRSVSFEVARARRGVAVSEELVKSAAEARALAERTDQLTRRSFEMGRASSLELVQTAAALRQADITLATREFELVQARLDAVLTEATCNW
jgi:outer membrane protein TolC